MSYEAWRISYQSSEQAARAAYRGWEFARKESQFLRSHRPIASRVTELEDLLIASQTDYQRLNTIATDLELQRDAALDSLEAVKKERDLYLDILRQPKWMNALGDNIG